MVLDSLSHLSFPLTPPLRTIGYLGPLIDLEQEWNLEVVDIFEVSIEGRRIRTRHAPPLPVLRLSKVESAQGIISPNPMDLIS